MVETSTRVINSCRDFLFHHAQLGLRASGDPLHADILRSDIPMACVYRFHAIRKTYAVGISYWPSASYLLVAFSSTESVMHVWVGLLEYLARNVMSWPVTVVADVHNRRHPPVVSSDSRSSLLSTVITARQNRLKSSGWGEYEFMTSNTRHFAGDLIAYTEAVCH